MAHPNTTDSTHQRRLRLGVLASGRGTTLAALLEASASGALPADIEVVVSNRPSAPALERARRAGVPAFVLSQRRFASRRDRDIAMAELLQRHGVDTVVLAGYDRVLSPEFLQAYPQRVVNIHPSLLPAFGGEMAMAPRPQSDALAYGCKLTGCTVHFVVAEGEGSEAIDGGPIIAQAAVPIYDDDVVESLAGRLLREEHRLLVTALRWLAEGRLRVEGRRVMTGRRRPEPEVPAALEPPGQQMRLGDEIPQHFDERRVAER